MLFPLALIFVSFAFGSVKRQQEHREHLARRGTPKLVRVMPAELRDSILQRRQTHSWGMGTVRAVSQMQADLSTYIQQKKQEAPRVIKAKAISFLDEKAAHLVIAAALAEHLQELAPHFTENLCKYLSGISLYALIANKLSVMQVLDATAINAVAHMVAQELISLIPIPFLAGIPISVAKVCIASVLTKFIKSIYLSHLQH